MDALYYAAMLLGVAWLVVWSILPRPWRGGGFWIFDMRDDVQLGASHPRPLRRRQDAGSTPAAAVSSPPATPSWRQRRVQPTRQT